MIRKSYYQKFIEKLIPVCKRKKIFLEEIGKIKELPFYKIVLNPLTPKTVVFSAGIHGDEISGPWSIVDFLKKYDVQKYPATKIILFPVANPTGFDKKTHTNHLRKDLNRLFHNNPAIENKYLLRSLENENIFFFQALHEDVDENSFYLYNFEKTKEKIYREIINLVKNYFPINKSAIIYDDPATNGLVINRFDGSFEDKMFSDGIPYSLCTEVPGKQPLKKRIQLNLEIMEKILTFSNQNF